MSTSALKLVDGSYKSFYVAHAVWPTRRHPGNELTYDVDRHVVSNPDAELNADPHGVVCGYRPGIYLLDDLGDDYTAWQSHQWFRDMLYDSQSHAGLPQYPLITMPDTYRVLSVTFDDADLLEVFNNGGDEPPTGRSYTFTGLGALTHHAFDDSPVAGATTYRVRACHVVEELASGTPPGA
jgi:hypothetical protein